MGIGIQRKSNRIMSQQNRERFRIHALLHCTGRKGMPQCMKVAVRQIGRRQHLLIIFAHEARLDIEAVLLRSNQTAVEVGSAQCGCILHLHGSPVLEVHHQIGQHRDTADTVLRFRCLRNDLGFAVGLVIIIAL